MIIEVTKEQVALDVRARGSWCLLPYPNHPKGCPNYNKKSSCPPFSKRFEEIVVPPYYLIIETFDLGEHARKMKQRHPEWSDRQCRNLLYWQKGVVKRLKEKAIEFMNSHDKDLVLLEVPEANGINVFKTCENVNIVLEKHPQKIIRKIMIVGTRKDLRNEYNKVSQINLHVGI